MRRRILLMLALIVGAGVMAQERRSGRKPVLIREDPVEQTAEEEVYSHDPEQARKNVEVGDFYFKKKNFKAAESRYRAAIKYNTGWPVGYEKLIKALEKQGEIDSAIETCYEFVDANPSSGQVREFEKRADKFKSKRSEER